MIIKNGILLRAYRENAGLSQSQLSRITGIPRGTISASELRRSKIDRKTAKIYDKAFNLKKSLWQRILDLF